MKGKRNDSYSHNTQDIHIFPILSGYYSLLALMEGSVLNSRKILWLNFAVVFRLKVVKINLYSG